MASPTTVVTLPGRWFLAGAAAVALGILAVGRTVPMSVALLAAEVFVTILALFLFGSFRYQVHKGPLAYGMLLIIGATFISLPTSTWHVQVGEHGFAAWLRTHLLSFHGLNEIIHADTMLFLLGLTLFVAVIAQTRLLEGITFFLLRRNKGHILPTVLAVTGVVAFASGILDGVSMVGLTVRTLVIIMTLAAVPPGAVRYAVMVCTTITTICGVWLAYGEPPNLIMKANLHPQIGNAFFLIYCAPAAVVAYLLVAQQLRTRLRGKQLVLDEMDILDTHVADVRFLQAARHGEVLSSTEVIEAHAAGEPWGARAIWRIRNGEPLGPAMVREDVPFDVRRTVLGHFVSEELADGLDRHYLLDVSGRYKEALKAQLGVAEVLAGMSRARRQAQQIGALALIPFIVMLVVHGFYHDVPLFLASFAGFFAALPAVWRHPRMRALALTEARVEYAEYYFLFPLFLSITLLTSAGFFDGMQRLIVAGIDALGPSHVAFIQFLGSTVLSAILDNNVAADFASRGLTGLDLHLLELFAMAQIVGYALGGCWTHIGCAQSVVAYAFIQRDLDPAYTPVEWIREMTPVIIKIMVALTVLIYAESALLDFFVAGT
jgi:Na+/H+ antiporter NhaD/arsenite permease-like protein